MVTMHVHTQFHLYTSDGSLVIAVELNVTFHFCHTVQYFTGITTTEVIYKSNITYSTGD